MGPRQDEENRKLSAVPVAKTGRALVRAGSSFGLLFTSAVAILMLALASFAGFSNNREAGTSGVAIHAESEMFDLGVVTDQAGSARRDAVSSTVLDLLSERQDDLYGRDELRTGGVSGVICALLSDEDHPLRPGSTGTLQFRIFPKRDSLTFFGQLYMGGTRKVVDLETSGAAITYELLEPETRAADEEALDYLAGHLLFFTDAARLNLVPDGGSFAVTGASEAGGDYLVTLYWTWPRTHAELVEIFSRPGFNVSWQDWSATHSYLYQGTDALGYNNADQLIGERVHEVIVEADMNAGTAGDLPSGVPTVAAVAQ